MERAIAPGARAVRTPILTLGNRDWADVVEDTDNLPHDFGPKLRRAGNDLLDANALLERVETFQIASDEFFVDHGDANAGSIVLRRKTAALDDIDTEGLEVVGTYRLEISRRAL